MNEIHVYMYRRLTIAILLIAVIAMATVFSMGQVNQRAEKHCRDTLYNYTKMLNRDIGIMVEGDRTLLRTAAKLIMEYDLMSSPELLNYLREFENDSTITRIGLLLPGDTVVFSDGLCYDVSGILSYEKEASLGEHISDREQSISAQLGDVVRCFIPLEKDGETVAMLYGAVELANLPELIDPGYYDGKAAVYVIDGKTGDFLVDTWHQNQGNLYDLGNRKMKEGYSQAQMNEDLKELRPGYVAFVSETINEYLYFCYSPSGINQWSVAVSVPEEVAFAEAIVTRDLLFRLALFECVCFAFYFLWVCFDARREMAKKQRRIDIISYLYDVEKILFTAHREKECIRTALERICQMSGTSDAFFVIYEEKKDHQIFVHSESENSKLPALLQANDCYQNFCRIDDGAETPQDVMVIPVSDVDDNIIGALGIYGWKTMPNSAQVLESVAPSFTMLYNNIKNFNRIKDMSEKDLLTGLLNRNSFEDSLSRYPRAYASSIAVVYADANGLHELNNSQGHEAGDRMLRFVAQKIKEQFGGAHTYRIGGDEFVAFALDTEEKVIQKRLHVIDTALTKEGYHASIGMAWEKTESSVNLSAQLKLAEQRMYDAKRQWYQQQGMDRRAR